MTDKVLCPYCGAEMKRNWKCTGYGEAAREAWYVCEVCKSDSPTVWGCDYETAVKLATEAALRRYTPPQKPMSFEAVLTTDAELWMEERNDGAVWACRCFFNGLDKRITAQYIASYPQELDYADYGRTWRCWFQRPTKEQMEAATWNN